MLDVQALARSHTEQAVRALVEALRDPRHKVAAAQALLDRGWGRPVQSVAATDGSLSVVGLHLLAAKRIGQELAAELETRTTINGSAEQQQAEIPRNLLDAPLPTE